MDCSFWEGEEVGGCQGIDYGDNAQFKELVCWSIRQYEKELELFFEREAYEFGAMKMLREMVERPGVLNVPHAQLYEDDHAQFVANVKSMLSRRSYFADLWNEVGEAKGD